MDDARKEYLLNEARKIVEGDIETRALERIVEKEREIRGAKRMLKRKEQELQEYQNQFDYQTLLVSILEEYEI